MATGAVLTPRLHPVQSSSAARFSLCTDGMAALWILTTEVMTGERYDSGGCAELLETTRLPTAHNLEPFAVLLHHTHARLRRQSSCSAMARSALDAAVACMCDVRDKEHCAARSTRHCNTYLPPTLSEGTVYSTTAATHQCWVASHCWGIR